MAVGARDYIDQLLVKKYADEKVDNHDALESMIDPNKMLDAMNIINKSVAKLPIAVGDVLINDLFGSDVVATMEKDK